MLDPFGDSNQRCAAGLNGRSKVLCCNAPKTISPYLPVDLDKIFPTLPPKSDYPDFDLQNLGGDSNPVVNEPNQQTFGMVIIDGPPDTVSNLQRRDGIGLEVLDCEGISETGSSTIRVVCTRENPADCEIGGGVVDGTILRMPDGCGPGTYAMARALRPAENQHVPAHVRRALGDDLVAAKHPVHDLEISYNFTHVKRDSGDIYIRIDYSNTVDFWEQIVQADPVQKRDVERRFWSASDDAWKAKFDTLRDAQHQGQSSLRQDDFRSLLAASKGPDDCQTPSFLQVSVGGSIYEEMKFGFSFVGTIAPTFALEEAHGFFDARIMYHGYIDVNARGAINIDSGLNAKPLWDSPISSFGFSHPGICSLRPELNIEARLAGSGYAIDGNFTANFIAGHDLTQSSHLNQPLDLGDATGDVTNVVPDTTFTGTLSTETSDTSTSSKKRDLLGTVLAIDLDLLASMRLEFFWIRLDLS